MSTERQTVIAEINDVIEKADQLADALHDVIAAKGDLVGALAQLAKDQPTELGREAMFIVTSMFPAFELNAHIDTTKVVRDLMDQLLGFV